MRLSPVALVAVPLLFVLAGCASSDSRVQDPDSVTSASEPAEATALPAPTKTPTPTPIPTVEPTATCENIVTPERVAVLRSGDLKPTEGDVRISAGTEILTAGILCTWSPPDPRSDGWPSYGWAPLEPGQREAMEAELENSSSTGGMFDRDDAVTYATVEGGGPIAYRITDEAVWIAPRISHLESVTWGR